MLLIPPEDGTFLNFRFGCIVLYALMSVDAQSLAAWFSEAGRSGARARVFLYANSCSRYLDVVLFSMEARAYVSYVFLYAAIVASNTLLVSSSGVIQMHAARVISILFIIT